MLSKQSSCQARTSAGDRCEARPIASSRYCFFHHPAKAKARKNACRRGGKNRVVAFRRPDVQNMPISTHEGILALIETIITDVRRGVISPKVATSIGYLINIRVNALPMAADGGQRNVTPQRMALTPNTEERSEQYRKLMARVIENQIKKAKAYNQEVPDDWKPLSELMDKEQQGANADDV